MNSYYKLNIQNKRCLNNYHLDTNNPYKVAKQLEALGAEGLFIIDLDGAFNGQYTNYDLLDDIMKDVNIPIITGGGIRSIEDAKRVLGHNVDKIILGTAAIKNQEMLVTLLEENSDKVIVSIDSYDGSVFIDGWEENVEINLLELVNTLSLLGAKDILFTDISIKKDQNAINFEELEQLVAYEDINIMYATLAVSDEDKRKLDALGIHQVILESLPQ